MESNRDLDLDPNKDDLSLQANTNHMLVRHYALDLSVHFQRKVIGGSIVLFLDSPITPEPNKVIPPEEPSCLSGGNYVSNVLWGDESEEFTLVLVQRLVSMPSVCWRLQHEIYVQCSLSPCAHNAQPLRFHTDRWRLQIRKEGACSPHDFPCAVRIWYETKPTGSSVRWTKDQDGRCCVYTMGSPINNRALFPCQEPPVAMSTWQARVRAPCDYTVLTSGENQAFPKPAETGFLQWDYYVTMPMTAFTFTIAVGQWLEAGGTLLEYLHLSLYCSLSLDNDDQQYVCANVDYPCCFMVSAARAQTVIPHRVFAPPCHLQKANDMVLHLLPLCLTATHSILGVHPFSRLDVLIVPSGFSSLGMASPHVVSLSQSKLRGERNLCGARLCHEIAHSWFGLAIGARDWTGEWISEGVATCLEDVFWSHVQKLSCREAEEQRQLKALLHWRRLSDELQNSEEELQYIEKPYMQSNFQDACSEWLRTPEVQEVKGEVAKWIHFSGSGGKGSKRKRAGPKVNFKEVRPHQMVIQWYFDIH
uniref:Aminopeptidase O (putative) n=1 Tax=Sinocyclocheilus grahami TaxID=75366 RepID=A0A672RTC1_SINGR